MTAIPANQLVMFVFSGNWWFPFQRRNTIRKLNTSLNMIALAFLYQIFIEEKRKI